MKNGIVILLGAVFVNANAFAQPQITAINPSGNIAFCKGAPGLVESYRRSKQTAEAIKAKYGGVQPGMDGYEKAKSLIETVEENVAQAANLAKKYNQKPIGWLSVAVDGVREIPLARVLDSELGIEKVNIVPSEVAGNIMRVAAGEVTVTVFPMDACKYIIQHGGTKDAFQQYINELFSSK